MKDYVIRNERDLEKYKDEFGYHVQGNAEFKYSASFNGRLLVDGWLTIEADGSIKAGGSIEAGEYIKAGWSIEAGESIEAGGYIEAGLSIEADGSIKAGAFFGIVAGLYITCKKELKCGLKVFAGICTWREITDEEKTITCGKFEGGVVEYGILHEVGMGDNLKKIELLQKADELIKKADELKEKASEF